MYACITYIWWPLICCITISIVCCQNLQECDAQFWLSAVGWPDDAGALLNQCHNAKGSILWLWPLQARSFVRA
jgi:hypothetical protein